MNPTGKGSNSERPKKVAEEVYKILLTKSDTAINEDDIFIETDLDRKQVKRVLKIYTKKGVLEKLKVKKKYTLEDGRPLETPVYKIKKELLEKEKPEQGRPRNGKRDKVWEVIRLLSKTKTRFTKKDIEAFSEIKSQNFNEFLLALVSWEYLLELPNTGRKKVYILHNDPGPTRPKGPIVKDF
jgi:predicted transcriptional regulator